MKRVFEKIKKVSLIKIEILSLLMLTSAFTYFGFLKPAQDRNTYTVRLDNIKVQPASVGITYSLGNGKKYTAAHCRGYDEKTNKFTIKEKLPACADPESVFISSIEIQY